MGKNLFTFAGKGKPGVTSIPYLVRLTDQDGCRINDLRLNLTVGPHPADPMASTVPRSPVACPAADRPASCISAVVGSA
jgi:hypothetical protein